MVEVLDGQLFLAKVLVSLLPEKAILLPEFDTLIVTDLHLGKIEHFRKSGIPLPIESASTTLVHLSNTIQKYVPDNVIFLGDLFHSKRNNSFSLFEDFLKIHANIQFILVKGNHDIYPYVEYEKIGLQVLDDWYIGKLCLTHEPLEIVPPGFYNISGHVHPSIHLTGLAKQSLVLPCFAFYEDRGVLPAFGYFTGKSKIIPNKNTFIFAVIEEKIVRIAL